MPSAKVLQTKQAQVEELTTVLKDAVSGVVVDYKGISVADDTKLRKELREAGIKYVVAKNTLLNFAADKADLAGLKEHLAGTTAIAVSNDDYVAAARILQKFVKTTQTPFNIKAGFVDGAMINADEVKALSKLPAREVLIAQVLGGLNAPITSFVYVLDANISGLARTIAAIAAQKA